MTPRTATTSAVASLSKFLADPPARMFYVLLAEKAAAVERCCRTEAGEWFTYIATPVAASIDALAKAITRNSAASENRPARLCVMGSLARRISEIAAEFY